MQTGKSNAAKINLLQQSANTKMFVQIWLKYVTLQQINQI